MPGRSLWWIGLERLAGLVEGLAIGRPAVGCGGGVGGWVILQIVANSCHDEVVGASEVPLSESTRGVVTHRAKAAGVRSKV